MTNDNMTRWSVLVSKETDNSLRSFMSDRGMPEGELSRFIEEAVKWRVFDQTLSETREKFSDLAPDELQALIDEATAGARAETPPPARPKNA
jgi:hypothetical protein